mgnify:CR=1 FL=1
MTTEEFYKANLKVGTTLKRRSDGKVFEVASIREVKQFGKPQMEYILQTEAGGRVPTDSHWIDCYFDLPH